MSPITLRADADEWPAWVPIASATTVFVTVVFAIVQRTHPGPDGIRQNLPLVVAFSLLALVPFSFDVISTVTRRFEPLPLWLYPTLVLPAIAYLAFHPAQIDFAPFVLVFMSAEVAARSSGRMPLAIATGLASIAVMVIADVFGPYDGSFIWVTAIAFGWFGGYMILSLDRRTEQLRVAQAGLAEKAAADERSRIAREVHDVIAHSMSVTMLHVTAARMALERQQSPQALDALREAEQQGRRSMIDIRRTVGLLGPDASGVAPPMPGVADLPNLVSDFTSAGLDVALSMEGDLTALPATAGLSVYRIVQESLTNVTKHAPGAGANVALRVSDDQITLRIHNASGNGPPPAPAEDGLGVRGMIERSWVLQGSLEAGPDGDGWTVLLVAPRPAVEPT